MVTFTLTDIDEGFWNRFINTFPRQVTLQDSFKYLMYDWVRRIEDGTTTMLKDEETIEKIIKKVMANDNE